MKKISIFRFVTLLATLAGLWTASPAVAQTAPDFRVRVVSGEDMVGYAYVLINGEFHAMANEQGETRIPASKLKKGDIISARFVGMESIPLTWDGSLPAGAEIRLELIPDMIDEVVVTARDRSRRYFRQYVKKMPTHGWYTGFLGEYEMSFSGDRPWRSRGKYQRNHVPGDDANLRKINTFSLQSERAADSLISWQIQRYILLVSSIAERAVQLEGQASNRGMIMKYRGMHEGRNVFLIIKPYFDQFVGTGDSFQTLIYANAESGLVTSAKTVNQTRYGVWNVSADYAVYAPSPDRSSHFIYPTRIEGNYQERDPSAEDAISGNVIIVNTGVHHFSPDPIPLKERE